MFHTLLYFVCQWSANNKGDIITLISAEHLSPLKTPNDLTAQQRAYRTVVIKDLIDSEKAHITDLQNLMTNVLHLIEKSEM